MRRFDVHWLCQIAKGNLERTLPYFNKLVRRVRKVRLMGVGCAGDDVCGHRIYSMRTSKSSASIFGTSRRAG